jgi:hypothetical protein
MFGAFKSYNLPYLLHESIYILLARFSESKPKCTSNISMDGQLTEENSTLEITCDVTFNGTRQPELVCEPDVSQETTENTRTSSTSVRYEKTFRALTSISGQHQTCRLRFSSTEIATGNVTRTDLTSWQWKSPILDVTCKSSV